MSINTEEREYGLKYISRHLYEAQQFDELDRLLRSKRYFEACRDEPTFAAAYRSALDFGWQSCTTRGPSKVSGHFRCILIQSSLVTVARKIVPELWPTLLQYGLWSMTEAIDQALLYAEPERTILLSQVADALPPGKEQETVVGLVIDGVLAFLDQSPDLRWYLHFISAVSTAGAGVVLIKSILAILREQGKQDHSDLIGTALHRALPELYLLIERSHRQVLLETLEQEALSQRSPIARVEILCHLAQLEETQAWRKRFLALVLTVTTATNNSGIRRACIESIAGAIALCLELLPDAVRCAQAITLQRDREQALQALLPHVPDESPLVENIWLAARQLKDPGVRLLLLMGLLSHVESRDRQRLIYQIRNTIRDLPDPKMWIPAELDMLERLSEEEGGKIRDMLRFGGASEVEIACATHDPALLPAALNSLNILKGGEYIDDNFQKIMNVFHDEPMLWQRILKALDYLTSDENSRNKFVQERSSKLRSESDSDTDVFAQVTATLWNVRLNFLLQVIPEAPESLRAQLLDSAHQAFKFVILHSDALPHWIDIPFSKYIPFAPEDLLPQIESFVCKLSYREKELLELAKRYRETNMEASLERLAQSALSTETESVARSAVLNLLPYLSETQGREILRTLMVHIYRLNDGLGTVRMAASLANVYAGKKLYLDRFLQVTESIHDADERFEALVTLSPFLSPLKMRQTSRQLLGKLEENPPKSVYSANDRLDSAFSADEVKIRLIPLLTMAEMRQYCSDLNAHSLIELIPHVPDRIFETNALRLAELRLTNWGEYNDALKQYYNNSSTQTRLVQILQSVFDNSRRLKTLRQVVKKKTGQNVDEIGAVLWFLPNPDLQFKVLLGITPSLGGELRSLALTSVKNIIHELSTEEKSSMFGIIEELEGNRVSRDDIEQRLLALLAKMKESKMKHMYAVVDRLQSRLSTLNFDVGTYEKYENGHIDEELDRLGPYLTRFPDLWQHAFREIQTFGADDQNANLIWLAKLASSPDQIEDLFQYKLAQINTTEGSSLTQSDIRCLIQIVTSAHSLERSLSNEASYDDVSPSEKLALLIWNLLRELQPRIMMLFENSQANSEGAVPSLAWIIPISLVPLLPRDLKISLADEVIRLHIPRSWNPSDDIHRLIDSWENDPELLGPLIHAVCMIQPDAYSHNNRSFREHTHNLVNACKKLASNWIIQDIPISFRLWTQETKGYSAIPRWMLLDVLRNLLAPLLFRLGGAEAVLESLNALYDLSTWVP